MHKNFEKSMMFFVLIAMVVILIHFIPQTVNAITGQGKVIILPVLFCGKTIDQFDHVISGTAGNDVLIVKKGNNLIQGLGGDDIIIGGKGNDCLIGGDGNDIIIGGRGNDNIQGDNGDDILIGGQGNNVIDGGVGVDICVGGKGQNIITNCETILKNPKNEFIKKILQTIEQARDKNNDDFDFIKIQSPKWFENDAVWWKENHISDDDFINTVQYLITAK